MYALVSRYILDECARFRVCSGNVQEAYSTLQMY